MRGYIFQVNQKVPEFLLFSEENPEILARMSPEGIKMYDLRLAADSKLVTLDPAAKTFLVEGLLYEMQGTVDDITQFPTFEFFPEEIVKAMTAINE